MNTEAAAKSGPHVGYLLEQHLEEVAFLNVQRRYLLFAPDVSAVGLLAHEERLAAHWDGLVVGGKASVDLAFSRLQAFDPWDVYAAVRVWLELGLPSAQEILEQMTEAGPDNLAGWRGALRRLPAGTLDRLLPLAATEKAEAEVQAALVFARSWHHVQRPATLPALVNDPCIELRRTLARALGWGVMETEAASGLLQTLVEDTEPLVARAALWSAVLLGNGEAVDHCRRLAQDGEADPFQIQVLGLLGQPADCLLVRPFLDKVELFPAAARALGYLGAAKAVPWLLEKHTSAQDEEIDDIVTASLGILLGEVADPEEEPLAEWWDRTSTQYSEATTWLRGRPRPWSLAPEDEPMESRWLSSLRSKDAKTAWLHREIPDGFFTAGDQTEALPGE